VKSIGWKGGNSDLSLKIFKIVTFCHKNSRFRFFFAKRSAFELMMLKHGEVDFPKPTTTGKLDQCPDLEVR